MNNDLIKGSFVLLVAMLITKIIGAIYRIPLSNILKAEGIGLYQMVFPIYSLLLVFVTTGISVAISKKVATHRANNDYDGIAQTLNIGFVIAISLGILFGLILFFARNILGELQGNPNASIGYVAISIGFVFSCIISVYRGYFQGYEKMMPTAISQIIEQVVKLVFGLLFAFLLLSKGTVMAVFGALLGVSLGEVVSFLFLLVLFKIDKNKKNIKNLSVKINKLSFTSFVSTALPISINNVIMPLSNAIDSLIIVNLLIISGFTSVLGTQLYGIFSGVVMPIINLPVMLVSTLSVTLLPKISYNIKKGNSSSEIISNTLKFVWVFILPCTIGMVLLSQDIFSLLYPNIEKNLLTVANQLFAFSAVYIIFASLSNIATCILQSYGYYKYPMISMLIGSIVKVVLTIILLLIPQINILGIAISQSFAYGIICILNIRKVQKLNLYHIDAKGIIAPVFFTIAMATAVCVLIYFTNLGALMTTIFSILTGITVYLLLIFAFKIVNMKQIKNLFKNY